MHSQAGIMLKFQSAEPHLQRLFAYGLFRFGEAFEEFKPDIVVVAEDIWSVAAWMRNSKFWNKATFVTWMPYDAEPMTEEFSMFLKDFKYSFILGERGIALEVKEAAKAYLAEKGYDPVYGARPMRRILQSEVEDPLSARILEGLLPPGSSALIDQKGDALIVKAKRMPAIAPKPLVPEVRT